MTALFAEVSNSGSEDVSIVGGQTGVAAMVEVHEVVDGVMREKSGGVPVPAGGKATLMPGGDHIMLMGLTSELVAGDRLEVVVKLSDGSELVVDAEIRNFAAGDEEYEPGHGDMEMDMDMEHSHEGSMD
jgi:copper(I)-binding protein